MKVSINWIKEFVDLSNISIEEIIRRFGLCTAEIDGVIYKGQDISGIVLAKILEVNKVPNSTKLHVLKVDDGSGEPVQVVCGAPNVRVGMITAFARNGANVCGKAIGKTKLAGIDSYGMCCGETELGISSVDSGIMDISTKKKMGTDIKQVFPLEDVILEIENKTLTNRPDLWCHYGIARELATIFERPLKTLELMDLKQYVNLPKVNVKIKTPNCYRYSTIAVKNVNVKISPIDMKIKLNYCGMQDINLLADITNYVMLEVGQPMHAFDNEVVKGITVCEKEEDANLVTLEGDNHAIPKNSVIICDEKEEPVAIAGIKGGLKSGITEKTNSLLLESATFNATAIRKASQKLALQTDASMRYEKSLDPENTTIAIARLLNHLKIIDKGIKISSRLTDVYNFKYPKVEVKFKPSFINKRGNVKIETKQMISILKNLGFKVKQDTEELTVTVPSFRATKDVSIKEDILEEILRIYGYDKITPVSCVMSDKHIVSDKKHILEYKTKRLLAEKYGVSELHSYVWNYVDFNKLYSIVSPSYLNLMDASNSGQSGLRSKLAPTMLKFYYENKNNFSDVRICEIGKVWVGLDSNNLAIEQNHLAIVLASQTKTEKELYFELKAIVENICNSLMHTKVKFVRLQKTSNYLHPINSCNIVGLKDEMIGEMGILHPANKLKLDKRFNVAVLELDYNKLAELEEVPFIKTEVSKYQTVNLDFNFLVPNTLIYDELNEIIKEFRCSHIMEYSLKDVYENKELLLEKVSYTFNFSITPKNHTLEGHEIEQFSKRLIDHMAKHGIVLR